VAIGWGITDGYASISLAGYSGGFKSLSAIGGAAFGDQSVALGSGTIAYFANQVALGVYNDPGATVVNSPLSPGSLVFTIGNGRWVTQGDDDTLVRSNAFSVAWNGNTQIQGAVNVQGGTADAPATSVFQHDVHVQGVLRVAPAGDVNMGDFTQGTDPRQPPQ
jgi:hypothetical protein